MAINQSAIKSEHPLFTEGEKEVLRHLWRIQQLRESIVEVKKLSQLVDEEQRLRELNDKSVTSHLGIVELIPVMERLSDLDLYLTLKIGEVVSDVNLPILPKEYQEMFKKYCTQAKA
jgi:hypothetical protein